MDLQIPKSLYVKVAALLQLPVNDFDLLQNRLKDAPPARSASDLVASLNANFEATPAKIEDAVTLLVSWYWLRVDSKRSGRELVDALETAALSSGDANLAAGWDERRDAMARILELDTSVGLTAKAAFLSGQTFRNFNRARIFTDARPIFTADSTDVPSTFVMLHTLQITAVDSNARKEWYFTLDLQDLRDVRDSVERAIRKHEGMTKWLSTTSAPVLGGSDE